MNTLTSKKIMYTVIIHDYIPDVLRGMLCRRLKNPNTENVKFIKCPCCRKQLTAVNTAIKVEIHRYSRKTDVICHEYRRCNSCSETIGFIFTLG